MLTVGNAVALLDTPAQWGRGQTVLALGLCPFAGPGSAVHEAIGRALKKAMDGLPHNPWALAAGFVAAKTGLVQKAELEALYLPLLQQMRVEEKQNQFVFDDLAPMDICFAVYPFFAWYEMHCNGKENGGLLFARLRELQKIIDWNTACVNLPPQEYLARAVYTLALALVWQNTDEEVFEQYAEARQFFRQSVKAMVQQRFTRDVVPGKTVERDAGDLLLAYCICYGVREYALLEDRYSCYLKPLTIALEEPCNGACENLAYVGAAALLAQEQGRPVLGEEI